MSKTLGAKDDDDNSSSSSLRNIDHDLQEVEEGLRTTRRRRGRAFFDSINSMLHSVRQRLESRGSGMTRDFSDRLEAAELAHSSRVPLDLLRSAQLMQQQQQENNQSRSLLIREVSHGQRSVDSKDSSSRSSEEDHHRFHRSSSLVASRAQADAAMSGSDDLDLHETVPTIQEYESKMNQSTQSMEVDDDIGSVAHSSNGDLTEPETPILLSRRRPSFSSLTRSISGSLLPTEDDKAETFSVYSWGPASVHSLHDDDQARPVEKSQLSSGSRIGRLSGLISVAAGPRHAACVTNNGEVYICGDNSSGAVNPTLSFKHEIIKPSKLELFGTTEIRQVSCGFDHSAALTSMGAVLTWGSDDRDQLGHFRAAPDSPTKFVRPKSAFLGPGVRGASVACGNKFTMVLTTRMSVLVCGDPLIAPTRPSASSAGDQPSRRLPGQLHALVGLPLVSVAAGKDHAVVLTAHGTAYAWGRNISGCCGRLSPKELSPVPIVVMDSLNGGQSETSPFPGWKTSPDSIPSIDDDLAIVDAACGYDHTVLVTRSGRLLVCGANDEGQLGVSDEKEIGSVKALVHPDPDRSFKSAEAANKVTMLLDDVGDVWLMGRGATKTSSSAMSRVLEGKSILAISAGGSQCIAVAVPGGTHRLFSMTGEDGMDPKRGSELAHDLDSLVVSVSHEMDADSPISADGEEIVKRTEELLKYPAVLNSLFLDPSELEDLYDKISRLGGAKLQRAIASAVERSISAGLDSLQSEGARLMYPEAVRFLLHYSKFFDRDTEDIFFDAHGTCIVSLCEALLSLPYEGFQAFMKWLSLFPREMFVRLLLKPYLAQLTIALNVKIDADGVQHRSASRRAVPCIVAVLRWLRRASERAGNASAEDFYCEGVGNLPLEVLFEDLMLLNRWKKEDRNKSFLICASPFLIPPSKKRDLLQIESNYSMMKVSTEDARIDLVQGTMEVDPFYVLEIERENLVEQTLSTIKKAQKKDLLKKLRVKFKGEEGVDAGGVTREFFQLLSEDLFDISSGMWTRRFGEEVTWFNTECTWDDEGYELVGVLVGLALYNGVLLDVHFPTAFYRKLLNLPLGLEDVVDPELRKGLRQLLDYDGDDVEDIFCLSFEVSWMDLGKERTIDLKPNGSNIPVTSANKEEYVVLYVRWLLVESVHAQWESFKMGFLRVMENASLDLFQPEELELLVVGSPELDFEALEQSAEYEGGYSRDSAVIKNLWKFVKTTDRDTQLMFLKFATGASKAPIGGLGALTLKIQRNGPDSPQLPTSHTCFNTLLLPDYGDDYDKLAQRLGRAVLECEGFGLE